MIENNPTDIVVPIHRRDLRRVGRGLRTPEDAYYVPILQALAELGGSAPIDRVLTGVGSRMKGMLRPVDLEHLASAADMPRWQNAARWARVTMVRDGLLKANSPRGVWEITDAGRRAARQSP